MNRFIRIFTASAAVLMVAAVGAPALAGGGSDTTGEGFHCYAFFTFDDDPDKFVQAMINEEFAPDAEVKINEVLDKYEDEGATLVLLTGNVEGVCEGGAEPPLANTCPCTSYSTAASGDIGVLGTSIRRFAVGQNPDAKMDRFRCTRGVFGTTGFSWLVEFAEVPLSEDVPFLEYDDVVMEFKVLAGERQSGAGCSLKVTEGSEQIRIYQEDKFNVDPSPPRLAPLFPPFMLLPDRPDADFLACRSLYPTVEASIRAGLDTIFRGTDSSSCTLP